MKTALPTSKILEHLNIYYLLTFFFFFFSNKNNNIQKLSTAKTAKSRAISQVKKLEQRGTLGTNLEQLSPILIYVHFLSSHGFFKLLALVQ